MTTHVYRLLLGASLAVFVAAAGAANAPDAQSRMPADKGSASAMPAQPSAQPTDKMSADKSAKPQTTANAAGPAKARPMRHAHRSAMRHHEAVSPEENSYRQALRQCAKERDESQRDSCLDNAIEQHQPS
ncbi:MAG: hypothetical protein ACREYB_07250 [Casimicrobiaceae bacterium]